MSFKVAQFAEVYVTSRHVSIPTNALMSTKLLVGICVQDHELVLPCKVRVYYAMHQLLWSVSMNNECVHSCADGSFPCYLIPEG